MKKALFLALGLVTLLAACGSSDSTESGGPGAGGSGTAGSGTGGNGTGGTGGSGQVCYDPGVQLSTTDGSSACEPTCSAGQHCTSGGVNCLNGCLSAANCAKGQLCDGSANTMDLEGRPTGICRDPTPIACPAGTAGAGGTGQAGAGQAGSGQAGTSGSGVSCLFAGNSPSAACSTYEQCVETKCDANLKVAFGNDYKTGGEGGACKDLVACVSAQGCSEQAFTSCAPKTSQDCQNALGLIKTCNDQNCKTEDTACHSGTVSGGGGAAGTSSGSGGSGGAPDFQACTNLFSCCAQLDDTNEQQKCFATAGGTDTEACTTRLNGYKTAGTCP